MKAGFWPGVILGGALAIGLGLGIAILPTTPTWALWDIKRALDRNDVAALRARVDLTAVTLRAVSEFGSGDGDGGAAGIDLKQIGSTLLGGGKVLTVFNDPERPLRLDARDFVSAWWNMRREGNLAYLTIDADGDDVSLVLGRDGSEWRVVGVTPISALLRVKPKSPKAPRDGATGTSPGAPSPAN